MNDQLSRRSLSLSLSLVVVTATNRNRGYSFIVSRDYSIFHDADNAIAANKISI